MRSWPTPGCSKPYLPPKRSNLISLVERSSSIRRLTTSVKPSVLSATRPSLIAKCVVLATATRKTERLSTTEVLGETSTSRSMVQFSFRIALNSSQQARPLTTSKTSSQPYVNNTTLFASQAHLSDSNTRPPCQLRVRKPKRQSQSRSTSKYSK